MYTKSPWRHEGGNIYARATTWTSDFPLSFCVARVDLDRDDGMDNAQLVAAAPELLEALQKIDEISLLNGGE